MCEDFVSENELENLVCENCVPQLDIQFKLSEIDVAISELNEMPTPEVRVYAKQLITLQNRLNNLINKVNPTRSQ